MDKASEIYKGIVDELVKKSKSCAAQRWVLNGAAKGTGEKIEKYNALLSRLSEIDKTVLAEYVLDAYFDGIYDTLAELEWYIDCRDMKISVEGELLPTTKYEGLGNDFIGRASGDWDWYD